MVGLWNLRATHMHRDKDLESQLGLFDVYAYCCLLYLRDTDILTADYLSLFFYGNVVFGSRMSSSTPMPQLQDLRCDCNIHTFLQ